MQDHRIVLREDARAMGAVTALSKKAAPRWKSSKTRSGDCISIFPDGTTVPFTATKTRDQSKLNRHVTHRNNLSKRDITNNLLMSLPSIHSDSTV